jgi:hypothetical protein
MRPEEDGSRNGADDGDQRLARALSAQRARLLRRHAHRLQRHDLEDSLAQAALELVPRARQEADNDEWAPALALEQRFLSRVTDRRRALAGRSPAARLLQTAIAQSETGLDDALAIADPRGGVDEQIVHRDELRRLLELIAELTADQRLVAIHRLYGDRDPTALRIRQRWSVAKYEKLASRARARLIELRAEYDSGERCRRLAPDLHAAVFGGATPEQRARASRHVRNCRPCAVSAVSARRLRARRAAERASHSHATPTSSPSTGKPEAACCPVPPPRVGSRDVPGSVRPTQPPC